MMSSLRRPSVLAVAALMLGAAPFAAAASAPPASTDRQPAVPLAAPLLTAMPQVAAPIAVANLRLLPAAKDLAVDTVDVSAWYQPDPLSPAYLKYVKAGTTVTLEYLVTDAAGAAIANAPVTLNVNNKGGGENAIWTHADGTALTAAADGAYMQQVAGTTNSAGRVTFVVKNNNSDAQSESTRAVLNTWTDSSNGRELKGGFYPTIGAGAEHVDRFWPHIVTSGTGGGSGIAPGSGGSAGSSQSCAAFGDASSLCPPISQLAMRVTGAAQATAVVQGQALLATSSKDLTFTFTSTSGNAGKNLIVHFFDVSAGLTVTLASANSASSTACRAAEAANGVCVITADSAGGATFSATVGGAQVGRLFKFQINGPAGFTSGFVTAVYSANIGGGETADLCVDRTRVCPGVSRVSFEVAGAQVPVAFDAAGVGSALMPVGTTSLRFRYTSVADYAGKFAHIQFFDFSTGLDVMVPAGTANSSTSCDPGPAPGHGCYLQLDSAGSASFTVAITGAAAERMFRYQVSGVGGYASTSVAVTARDALVPACATAKILAQSAAASATSGTTTSVAFTVVDSAGRPCQGKSVTFAATGWGVAGSTTTTTDALGRVSVSASSVAATSDKSMTVKATTVTAKGAKVTASASIKWLKVPPPPTATVSASRGSVKVVIASAAGMNAVISYTGAATGSKTVAVASASATVTIPLAKGTYTVTVTIGVYSTSKSVNVS